MRLRWFTLLVVVFASLAPLLTVQAQTATPVASDSLYVDPAGEFTVPIPTGWSVTHSGDVAVLHSPDDELVVHLVVVTADDVTSGGKIAFGLIETDKELAATPDANQQVPPEAGIDETSVITFVTDGGEAFIQFFGQRVGERVYFMVFEGTVDAAAKRDSQVQQIASGFVITSLENDDLTEVALVQLTPALLLEFETYVSELMTKLGIPGASVSIVVGDQIVYSKGFGVKELDGDDPVTADTRMMIGSTTKSMTTMMMATGVDDGSISWDQPVIEILPEFAVADPDLSQTMTMRNMFCACTGVPRRDLEFLFNANELDANDVITSLADFKFFTGFGEAFQYSNQMVATGGYAAAAAVSADSGLLLDDYTMAMQDRVFDPIGMNRTTLSFETVEADQDYASPHGINLAATFVVLPLDYERTLIPVAPAGLVWSTANDMGKYLVTEIGHGVGPEGNRIVSSENLEETWIPQVAVDGSTSYGLGWFISDFKGLRMVDHGGNTLGFTSDLAFLPEQEIGIATLANAQGANLFNETVRTRFFEMMLGLPHEGDAHVDYLLSEYAKVYDSIISQIEDVPVETANAAVGTYESDVLGLITIALVDDVLTMDTGEFQTRLVLQSGTDTDHAAVLVAADPPIPGTPFELTIDDLDQRTVVLEFGTDSYVFYELDASEGATPVAA